MEIGDSFKLRMLKRIIHKSSRRKHVVYGPCIFWWTLIESMGYGLNGRLSELLVPWALLRGEIKYAGWKFDSFCQRETKKKLSYSKAPHHTNMILGGCKSWTLMYYWSWSVQSSKTKGWCGMWRRHQVRPKIKCRMSKCKNSKEIWPLQTVHNLIHILI